MLNLAVKLLLLAVLIGSFPAQAQENAPESYRGIFCDRPEQIERVAVLGTQLGGAWEGIQAVNKEVGGEVKACIHDIIKGVRGKDVKIIDTPEGMLAIAPFEVLGIYRLMPHLMPDGSVQIRQTLIERETPVVWFTLATPTGQEV